MSGFTRNNTGLKNAGNTCYISSVLQLIAGSPQLVDDVRASVDAAAPLLARRFVEQLNVMLSADEHTVHPLHADFYDRTPTARGLL
jgi:ubiquitin C-terminal hydrolase|eukprot:2976104-Prymnesium_polylepis.1